MRKQLWLPVLGSALLLGCAGSASRGVDVGEEDMPLSSYDSVFKGAPANESLPVIDLKADQIVAKSTDLLASQSPVQATRTRRGVCTIFTTTALMEHLYIKAGHAANPSFSEQYLQWAVKDAARRVARRRRLEHLGQRRGDRASSASSKSRSIRTTAPSGPRRTIPTACPTAPRRRRCRPSAGPKASRRPPRQTAKKYMLPDGRVHQHDRHQGAHHDAITPRSASASTSSIRRGTTACRRCRSIATI